MTEKFSPRLRGLLVGVFAHRADDLQAQLLRFPRPRRDACRRRALSASARPMKPMVSVPCLSTSPTLSFQPELLGVDPHALAHQERDSCCTRLSLLNVGSGRAAGRSPVPSCSCSIFEEHSRRCRSRSMAMRGRLMDVKRQIAAARRRFRGRVVDIAHHAGAAAHVGDFGLRMAGLVVLEVERRVDEREVREQALGGDAAWRA